MNANSEPTMTFVGHLEALRRALLKSIVVIVIATGICLYFSPSLYHFLIQPLQQALPQQSTFFAREVFEGYTVYFKISFIFGFFFSSPVIFYFFWSFIHPGLHANEKKGVIPIALISSLLFVGGAFFGYFVVFPPGFKFAVELYQGTGTLLMPQMRDYVSLAINLLLAFGIVFELPLMLLILGRLGILSSAILRRSRKYVIVIIFLLAGILTPGPDVLSQTLMAIPMLILFEVGILLVKIWGKRE